MELLLLLEGEPGELVGEEQPGPSGELKEFTVNINVLVNHVNHTTDRPLQEDLVSSLFNQSLSII